MLARLLALDRTATDRGLDVLVLVEKEPELLQQWLQFQQELLNRSADLGFNATKFRKKGATKDTKDSLAANDNGPADQETSVIDWFELSFTLTFQLRIQRGEAQPRTFPTPLPRKFSEMWPRKKAAVIAEEYDKIADSSVYGGSLMGMRKAAVRWCFTIDTFLSELEEVRLSAWKATFSVDNIGDKAADGSPTLARNALVEFVRGVSGSSEDTSDAALVRAMEAATERLRRDGLDAPESEPVEPTTTAILLNSDARKRLESLDALLRADYQTRRELTIERLDVTLQSFTWSKRGSDSATQMMDELQGLRSQLSIEPRQIDIKTTLATEVEPAVGASECKLEEGAYLRSIVIGPVPDRGGRTYELGEREMQQAKRGLWRSTTNHTNDAKSRPQRRERTRGGTAATKSKLQGDESKAAKAP